MNTVPDTKTKGPLIRLRTFARAQGSTPETFLALEKADPTFPRSFQLGGNTSPRYYLLPDLLAWFEAKSRGGKPTDAA